MAQLVALLRAVNVGRHRRVAMSELRELLTAAGYRDVCTYLQSGNVLLSSDGVSDQLARDLELQIRDRFALDVGVVVRTREELAAVVASDPLGDIAGDPRRYQVSFLASELDFAVAERIAAAAVAPEAVAVAGREIFAWHPEGIIRSPLAKVIADPKLGATARNWKTVTTLLELAQRPVNAQLRAGGPLAESGPGRRRPVASRGRVADDGDHGQVRVPRPAQRRQRDVDDRRVEARDAERKAAAEQQSTPLPRTSC